MILYDKNSYPTFIQDERLLPLMGFIQNKYSTIKLIYKIDEVYEILINSGLTKEECATFFNVDDPRECVVDGAFYNG